MYRVFLNIITPFELNLFICISIAIKLNSNDKRKICPFAQRQKIKQSTNSVENYNRRYRATFDIFELLLNFLQKGNIANLIRLHSSELICGFYEKK